MLAPAPPCTADYVLELPVVATLCSAKSMLWWWQQGRVAWSTAWPGHLSRRGDSQGRKFYGSLPKPRFKLKSSGLLGPSHVIGSYSTARLRSTTQAPAIQTPAQPPASNAPQRLAELGAAGGALPAGLAEDGEADGAHVAHVYGPLVAEAAGLEVDGGRLGQLQELPRLCVRREDLQQALHQRLLVLGPQAQALGDVRRLLHVARRLAVQDERVDADLRAGCEGRRRWGRAERATGGGGGEPRGCCAGRARQRSDMQAVRQAAARCAGG